MDLKLSRFVVATAPFELTEGASKRVLYSTWSGQLFEVDVGSFAAIEGGAFSALGSQVTAQLIERRILVPAELDELRVLLGENRAAAAALDSLYYVVQPTADCQLGCDYCGQRHTPRLLSQPDQDALVERVRQKLDGGRFRSFELGWFGAEPLMGLSVMRSLSPRLRALADLHACRYFARIATNGLSLTSAVATELAREHAVELVEVTLDGTQPHHDARRHRKGGQATFDRIFANVVALARRDDLPIRLSIRCNVDGRNHDGALPLVRLLAASGLAGRIDRFYIAPVHSWGNDADALSLDADEFAKLELEVFVEMLELGFAPKLLPARRPITCLTQKPEAEVADAFGNLYNCTEISYVPAYEAPPGAVRLKLASAGGDAAVARTPMLHTIGTLTDGTAPRTQWPFRAFLDEVADGRYTCHECRMLPVCGGACPKLWQEGKPPCPSAKSNIEHRVLLHHLSSRWKISRSRPQEKELT